MFYEFEDFLFNCESRKLSPKTIKGYRNINLAFIKWLNENYQIDDVTEIKKNHIQKYLMSKINEGRKDKYINGLLKVLTAFFTFLMEEDYIQKNPTDKIKYIREEKRPIETYTDKEAEDLVNAYNDIDYLSIRNKMIIALQIDTGIRCSETIDIQIQDVLQDRIVIHGKGKKIRTVPISAQIYKLFRIYRKAKANHHTSFNQGDYLFVSRTGRPLTVEAIERIYKEAGRRANITRKIRISPHTSRHYYAVKMLEVNDVYTVSKLMGHNSVKITETYLQSLNSDKLIDKGKITSPLTRLKY